MEHLFSTYKFKGLELKNRIMMPPMCQYSVEKKDGIATDWHYLHYVNRAIGGAGFIMIEMTDVEPDGRITDYDLGLWSDEQIPALARIVEACHRYGAKVGIQIAHAGRKAKYAEVPVAPSAIPFDENSKTPRALSIAEVKEMVEKFRKAVQRAVKAGVDAIEIHGAHVDIQIKHGRSGHFCKASLRYQPHADHLGKPVGGVHETHGHGHVVHVLCFHEGNTVSVTAHSYRILKSRDCYIPL